MQIIDRGAGIPIVVVPGLQGRWEYMRPAIDALAESFRVITFSLCGERDCPPFDPARGLDNFVGQIGAALDDLGLGRAAICGVSFGGLAALKFAAAEPHRTAALILVSTPGPEWRMRRRHEIYTRLPRVFGPLFIVETPWRLRAEIAAALPERRARLRFARHQLLTVAIAPLSLSRMALRARLVGATDIARDCVRVSVPTLVISGDPDLDRVVSADGTAQHARLIPGASLVRIEHTGHLGSITRPNAFSAVVQDFLKGNPYARRSNCFSRPHTGRQGATRHLPRHTPR